ncbi:MAG: asparagine synthase (glutamine-hydrolyzing) [Gallionellales bacterium 35-53-114]|jgi:asparagine synthase (glutamine-hydrolysing)|nr:MAG: asparagine synthase (glutamine-hydrolyzing) [Gallionellales bacterium 35-53-114]OYZ63422.1 MAG: asparagine synthase (glutamine-hydrolyzing) [Gallionellales bacterium 24-53-125]OZB10965.1 MAG: asparagine synthase (glutamine-hydrolyzing) [Gallionellales bacterium 39-52-133]HQS58851.1 asparagine synthase (glutamine-hydrolyzing) [Gallionellaceae bacterium]HQS75764.1 asparagine synthase (glutamine-hydrolyzing) [Gallionellaceae bacterium]
MCGIAGFNGGFSLGALKRMGERISHRGPDDSGFFHAPEHRVGLAHRRLSIIDLSPTGSQPMKDASGQVVIIFNGEIYNFRELRAELVSAGFVFRGHSDTEVLLNLYLLCGEEMLQRLNGVFAFAVWDGRVRSLFVARDGLGVKPLYYAKTDTGVVFASELKALLVNPEVKREIDPNAVLMHLTYLWCPAPSTILKGVKKLPPGHAMQIRDGEIQRQWKFYELPYNQAIVDISAKEAASQVEQAVRTAVERQMVADVPVGAFLSGGLDSSAVVAFAKQAQPDVRLQCFTIGFTDGVDEGFAEDLPYAKKVSEHLGVDLHTIYVGAEMADQLETMIYHLDEPLADPAPLNALFICKLAREHGIKVLLSGAGGDDIFSGYRRHYALQKEQYWNWLPHWGRHLLAGGAGLLPTGRPSLRRLRKAFEYADLDKDERLASYFYWGQPARLESLLSDNYRQEINGWRVSEPLIEALHNVPDHTDPLNRMLFLESKFFLPDHNLNYTDKMSMAVGVEVRVPLLDPDLVALAARLPVGYKQHGREGKWIFKKAMEKYLPREVIYRPKTGFGAPLRSWLHSENKLKPLMMDVLSKNAITRRGIFDSKSVESLIEEDAKGRVDATYTIFSMMCIELWCRKFLDEDVV